MNVLGYPVWMVAVVAGGVLILGAVVGWYAYSRPPLLSRIDLSLLSGGASDASEHTAVKDAVSRYWWVGVAVPTVGVLGYLFYLSLGLNLPSLYVAFGSLVFYCVGMAAFVGFPFFVSQSAPEAIRQRVFYAYSWLSQKAIDRSLLIKRGHAGVDLCASKFDADKGSEHVKLDGEWRDFEDIADRMYYLENGGAFGITVEGSTVLIDPIDAAIGKLRNEAVEAGEEVVDFGARFGEQIGECVREHVLLPESPPVVNLADAKYLLGGSADPSQAEATESFETKAWLEHQSVPVVDVMVIAGLFSAVLLVIWLAFSFKESGGSGGGSSFDIVSGALIPPIRMWFP